jgi:asparaginyl-tRNA synthetase
MQVVAPGEIATYGVIDQLSTGAACMVVGEVVESKGDGQEIELQASELTLVGACPADTYPLQKKRHSLEFLRTIAHLRPRSNLFGAVSRVRSALAQATHAFFAGEGFAYVQTPLITASDCEGAGEMFRVTTLDPCVPHLT